MTVTRDVVRDLLPLYLSGEVSRDTRALVEAYLTGDPELARAVASAQAFALPGTQEPALEDKAALDRTRRLIRLRALTLGAAIFLTMVPFSVAGQGSQVTFFMLRDAPAPAAASLLAGAAMWGWHLWIRRRLQVVGL